MPQERPGDPSPPRGRPRRIAGIDGLRGIAAIAILFFHVWGSGPRSPRDAPVPLGAAGTDVMNWLQSGVTLFFVLSGFLLFAPFARAVFEERPIPSIRRYLINRGLRILPLYWVVLAFTALTVGRQLLSRPYELLANVFLVQTYVPGYATGTDYQVLGINPAWSLCVEATFYLLLPVLGLIAFLAACRFGLRPLAAVAVPIAFMILGGLASEFVAAELHSPYWNQSLPVHAVWFAVGMSVALLLPLARRGRAPLSRPGSRLAAVAVILALTVFSLKLWTGGSATYEEAQTVTAVGCGLLLALVVLAPPGSALVRALESRAVAAAGAASYGIFLWHEPLLRALRGLGLTLDGPLGLVVNCAVVLALTLVVASATYRLVERPCLALKRNWRTTSDAPLEAREPETRPSPALAGAARQ